MESFLELGGGAEHPTGLSDLREEPAGPRSGLGPVLPSDGGSPTRPRWERRYALMVCATDLTAILIVVAVGHVLRLGDYSPKFGGEISPALGLVVTALTALVLVLTRAWDQRVLGQGSEEFSRLIRGFTTSAVVLGLAGLALQLPAVRPWVFGLLPLAGLLSLLGRFWWRKWLHHRRAVGRFMHPMLAVGTVESVEDVILRTRRDPQTGWNVRAACTPTGTGHHGAGDILGVPVVGDLDTVADAPRRVGTGSSPSARRPAGRRRLHRLAWDVEREHGPGRRPGPHGDGGPAAARRPGGRASAPAAHPADVRRRAASC